MIRASSASKSELVKRSGISRATLYYQQKLPDKDWGLKVRIEEVLREYSSYGHKRLAICLKVNKKRVLRVMHIFGIKPYRRRGKKPFKVNKGSGLIFPNLLRIVSPQHENHVWVADFTYISFQGKFIYVATIMDVYTRKIVGFSILANHNTALVVNALLATLQYNPRAVIFHSDNGSAF